MSVDDLKRVRGPAWSVAFDAIADRIESVVPGQDGPDAASLCEAAVSAIERLSGTDTVIAGVGEADMLRTYAGAWAEDEFPDLTAKEVALVERGVADRIAATQARRFSSIAEAAAASIDARDAVILAQRARIASLEARLAAMDEGDVVMPEYSETYWQEAIGGSYKPVLWGKHEAVHPVRIKEAIALAIEHAPACGDVIVAQVFFGVVARNREARLVEMLHEAQEGGGTGTPPPDAL